jgi:hypothetical protein
LRVPVMLKEFVAGLKSSVLFCAPSRVSVGPKKVFVPPLISTCLPATLKSGLMDIFRSLGARQVDRSVSAGSGSQWLFIGEFSGGVEPIAFLTP